MTSMSVNAGQNNLILNGKIDELSLCSITKANTAVATIAVVAAIQTPLDKDTVILHKANETAKTPITLKVDLNDIAA
jgi:hypothetical protein